MIPIGQTFSYQFSVRSTTGTDYINADAPPSVYVIKQDGSSAPSSNAAVYSGVGATWDITLTGAEMNAAAVGVSWFGSGIFSDNGMIATYVPVTPAPPQFVGAPGTIYCCAGDTPTLTAQFLDSSENAIDITGATLSLHMQGDTSAQTPRDVTVVNAVTGQVSYTFTPQDTAADSPIPYNLTLLATWSTEGVVTRQVSCFPSGYLKLKIQPVA